MKITIITPSLNQGNFIEQTIESVIKQNYPDLEHIIIDGLSTDNTLDILKKYDNKIKWISEKDTSSVEATNKGLKMASGDIISLLPSDDFYLPNTFDEICNFFKQNPEAKWVTGDYIIIDQDGNKIQSFVALYKRLLRLMPTFHMLSFTNFIPAMSTFWKKELISEIGFLDASLLYANDYDYWLKIMKKYPLYNINKPLSAFRIHRASTGGVNYKKQFYQDLQVAQKHCKNKLILLMHKLHNKFIIACYNHLKKF